MPYEKLNAECIVSVYAFDSHSVCLEFDWRTCI